jgi:hypothetical protein
MSANVWALFAQPIFHRFWNFLHQNDRANFLYPMRSLSIFSASILILWHQPLCFWHYYSSLQLQPCHFIRFFSAFRRLGALLVILPPSAQETRPALQFPPSTTSRPSQECKYPSQWWIKHSRALASLLQALVARNLICLRSIPRFICVILTSQFQWNLQKSSFYALALAALLDLRSRWLARIRRFHAILHLVPPLNYPSSSVF